MEAHHLPARHRRIVLPVLVGLFLAIPAMAVADHVFTDVPDGSTHANGIHYVAETGITAGCTATTYCPGANLTRGQMATFLHRVSGNAPGVAASVNAVSLAEDSVVRVVSTQTVTNAINNSHGTPCPDGTVVVGGGALTSSDDWRMQISYPIGNEWRVRYRSTVGAGNHTIWVYATCLRIGQ